MVVTIFNYSLSSQKTDLLAFVCHSDRDSNSHQHNQRQACCPPELLILANTDLCLFIFILCNNFCKKSTRLQRVTNSCSRSRRQTHWPQTTAWHWTQFKCKVQLEKEFHVQYLNRGTFFTLRDLSLEILFLFQISKTWIKCLWMHQLKQLRRASVAYSLQLLKLNKIDCFAQSYRDNFGLNVSL